MAEAETQLNDQQLEQKLAEQTAPTEVEYKTQTGQVFKGKDWEEIANKMAQSVENGSKTIKEQRDREQYLLQQIQERQNEQIDSRQKPPSKFDKLKYYETWQNDPMEAEREVIRNVLAEEFGLDSWDDVKRGYQFSYNKARELHQNAELVKFFGAHPEYEGNGDQSTKLSNWLANNGFEMDPARGKFVEAKDIEYAWYKLIESGDVTLPETTEQAVERRQPAPSLSGSGGTTGSFDDKVDKMNDKELETFLRKTGVLKY